MSDVVKDLCSARAEVSKALSCALSSIPASFYLFPSCSCTRHVSTGEAQLLVRPEQSN